MIFKLGLLLEAVVAAYKLSSLESATSSPTTDIKLLII